MILEMDHFQKQFVIEMLEGIIPAYPQQGQTEMIKITPTTSDSMKNELKTSHMLKYWLDKKFCTMEDCLEEYFPNMIAEDPILMMHVELIKTYRQANNGALTNAHIKRVFVRFREYAKEYVSESDRGE